MWTQFIAPYGGSQLSVTTVLGDLIIPYNLGRHKACMCTYILVGKHSSTLKLKKIIRLVYFLVPYLLILNYLLMSATLMHLLNKEVHCLMYDPSSCLILKVINSWHIIKKFSNATCRNFVFIVLYYKHRLVRSSTCLLFFSSIYSRVFTSVSDFSCSFPEFPTAVRVNTLEVVVSCWCDTVAWHVWGRNLGWIRLCGKMIVCKCWA